MMTGESFVADAPGRVNLIGEHTDYNGGLVLPIATPQRTRVILHPRRDDVVCATSSRFPEPPHTYRLGDERKSGSWLDYVQGVTCMLARSGRKMRGFDLHVDSEVPVGAGLSSSAALGVAVLRAIRGVGDAWLDDVELALVAHQSEVEFVGVPVGVMDPLASSLASEEEALFIDARSLAIERVPFPGSAELLVLDSGVSHAHAGGEYRVRRAECEAASARLGVENLRQAAAMLDRAEALPEPLNRRARHVITENVRVEEAVRAMVAEDLVGLGRLFVASHESLRDDFAVSVPEVDRLVDEARRLRGVLGARMTGGGFGGAVVVLCERPWARAVGDELAARVPGTRRLIPLGTAVVTEHAAHEGL